MKSDEANTATSVCAFAPLPDEPISFTNVELSMRKHEQRAIHQGCGTTEAVKTIDNPTSGSFKEPLKIVENGIQLTMTTPSLFQPAGLFLQIWDITMLFALIYTAFVTTYDLAFVENEQLWNLITNRIVDSGFYLDIGVNFNSAFVDPRSGLLCQSRKKM
jgi:hypothetical protein